MENQEHVLAKADIRYVKTKLAKITTIVFLVIVVLSLVIGLKSGTWSYHSDGGKVVNKNSPLYGQSYPAHDDQYIGWFGLDFYENSNGWEGYGDFQYWGHTEETYVENIILFILIYVVLFSLPGIITAIFKHECKVTSLTITDSQVYGSYNNFLFKKSLKMPIEKVDNLTTISGLMDKFRSGVTLGVCSASGIIKLHFVQNADEVIAAAIGRIEEIKEKEKRARVVAQPVAPAAAPSVSDKLKDLALMKEQGLITEDEFNKKREEILSKM